ncbi:hypothetical protein DRO66_02250 [Candidatus Bathyarchaeota archaeon]|nr:MAG: hypothetical protein DRO66_02250 [Candidatus Bathyarchaeota archaeon]
MKDIKFPAIFLNRKGRVDLLIDHNEINKCRTLKELMNLISYKLNDECLRQDFGIGAINGSQGLNLVSYSLFFVLISQGWLFHYSLINRITSF